MDLYIQKDGQNIGPLTRAQARQGLLEGRFQLNDHAIERSTNRWMPLEEVLRILETPPSSTSTTSTSVPTNPTWRDFIGASSASAIPTVPSIAPVPTTPSPTQRPASAPVTVKPWGCLYAIVAFFVIVGIGPSVEGVTRTYPFLGVFQMPCIMLMFVSLFALVVGLVDPNIIGRLIDKIPALKNRIFPKGFNRSHVGYIFGTAIPLFMFLAVGTDADGIQERDRYAQAQKAAANAEVLRKQQAALRAEQQRKAAVLQAAKEAKERKAEEQKQRLADAREEQLKQRRLEAEARSAEVQARIDERAEEARSSEAVKQAADREAAEAFEPKIRAGAFGVFIKNDSQTDWTTCLIMINAKLLDAGFHKKIPLIKAGEEVQIPLNEFVNTDNEFFTLTRYKLEKINMQARVNGDYKHFEGTPPA